MRKSVLLVVSVVLAALISSCGGAKSTKSATTLPQVPICAWMWSDSALVRTLNASWKKPTHVKGAWLLKSVAKGRRSLFEHGTIYLVGANIKSRFGIAVFAVDKKMVDTGSGFAVALNASAQAASSLGGQVSAKSAGLSKSTGDYQEMLDCARTVL
jgi:hypothetical protein